MITPDTYPIEEVKHPNDDTLRNLQPTGGNKYRRFIQPIIIDRIGFYTLQRGYDVFEGIRFKEWVPKKLFMRIGGQSILTYNIDPEKKEFNFFLPMVSMHLSDIAFRFEGDNQPYISFWADLVVGNMNDETRHYYATSVLTGQQHNIKWRIEQGVFLVLPKNENEMIDEDEKEEKKQPELDSCVKSVLNKYIKRAEFGKKKYRKDLDRTDLTIQEWVKLAQEEAMDLSLYLEKLSQLIK
jgi:hypothetical protein